ncbi:MAG: hypothetical protein ACTSSJ_01515 [Candidatus Odinarchaeia archaeon]
MINLTARDIRILTLIKEYPGASLREISENSRLSKDAIFRGLKRLKPMLDLRINSLINYPKIGLIPVIVNVDVELSKLEKGFESLKMPFLADYYLLTCGEHLSLLAFYALPNVDHLDALLGSCRSWYWHIDQKIFECTSVSIGLSFQYYSVHMGVWNINWPLWGFMIRDMLIKRRIYKVYPIKEFTYSSADMMKFDKSDLELLNILVDDYNCSIKEISEKLGLNYFTVQKKKRTLNKENVYAPYLFFDFKRIGLTDFVLIMIKCMNPEIRDALKVALQTLPYSITYEVQGDFLGIICFIHLPPGGLSGIFHVLSHHLQDLVDEYWVYKIVSHIRVKDHLPIELYDTRKNKWHFPSKIENRKFISYDVQKNKFKLPHIPSLSEIISNF